MDKKSIKGYMTVEASLLIPFFVILIYFIVFLGFYLYNGCALSGISYASAIRGANIREKSREEIKYLVNNMAEEMMEERLVMVNQRNSEVMVNGRRIKVRVYASMEFPVLNLISERLFLWETEREAEAIRELPEEDIREKRRE